MPAEEIEGIFRSQENFPYSDGIMITIFAKKDGLEKFPSTLPGFLKMDALPAKDKVILAGDLLNTVISRAIFGVKEKAVYDIISKHRLSKKTIQFVNALSYLLSGLSMERRRYPGFWKMWIQLW